MRMRTGGRNVRVLPGPVYYRGVNHRRRMLRVRVDKLSISFDAKLGDAVRSAAVKAGKPVSSWLAEAAASKLRSEALAQFLSEWESQHGALTPVEIAQAESELGLVTGGLTE